VAESPFPENYKRLVGLHGLTAAESASLVGASPQTVSSWYSGRRSPSARTLMMVYSFFEVPPHDLLTKPFSDLLPHVTDRERFERVEAKIAKSRRPMKVVKG
jgi:transcriptional regulator with XRE-family HTH domain